MMNGSSQAGKDTAQVAFITGASSGFGMLTTVKLAGQGFHVVASMRDTGKNGKLLELARAAGVDKRIECVRLDVAQQGEPAAVIEDVVRRYGAINVLVNNAGFAVGGFVEEVPLDDWRRQMETNFFGLVAVTQAALPSMRERGKGLIVNVGSISGRFGMPGYAPHASSKFAVEGFSEALRLEMLPYGVRVVLVEPGAYRTDIWDKGFREIRTSPGSPYRARLEAVLRISRRTADAAPDPQQVADLIARIARMKSPNLRYPLGSGARLSLWGKALLPWKWLERIIVRMMR